MKTKFNIKSNIAIYILILIIFIIITIYLINKPNNNYSYKHKTNGVIVNVENFIISETHMYMKKYIA